MIYARGNPAKWWNSRSVGIPSRAPASIGGIGNIRKLTSIMLLASLVLVVFSVWYITNPARVARLAENLLSNVFGGKVTVKSAHLSFSGTLLLSGVELNTEASPNSPRLPVFSADQIEVRFDWISLISGKLAATQLIALRPTLFLVEDVAGNRWNYERLRSAPSSDARPAAKSAPPSLPVVILRSARIQWGEVQNGLIEPTGQTIVDGQLVPEPNSPIYNFQITRHGVDSPRLADAAGTLMTGTWDVGGNRFSALMGKITLNEELKVILPRSVRKWWDEHHLAGAVSRFQINFDHDQGLVLDVTPDGISFQQEVQPRPADGSNPPRKFPVTFNNLKGNVTLAITKPRLKLTQLSGEILQFPFSADAEIRGLSPESPFDLNLHFKNADLPREYPALFMASYPVQDLLQRIRPSGRFDLDVSVKRLSWNGELFFDGAIACKNANMRFCHFPFPLHSVNGKILFNNEICTFDRVTAQGDETVVTIEGNVGTTPANATVDLTITSNRATLDERMAAALPEKFKTVWDDFAVRGYGKLVCKAHREPSASHKSEPAIDVTIDLHEAHGYFRPFPYHFSDGKGRISFAANETSIHKLTVRSGVDHSGTLTFNGSVKHHKGDVSRLQPQLSLTADVPIDQNLFALFPADYVAKLENTDITGRIGFTGTIKRNADINLTVPEITGELTLKNATAKIRSAPATQPAQKPAQDLLILNDLAASAHIAASALTIKQSSATTPEGLKLAATGNADFRAGTATLHLTASGADLVLPETPPLLFPDHARVTWMAYNPRGKIDLDATATLNLGPSAATQPSDHQNSTIDNQKSPLTDYSLNITLKSNSIDNRIFPESFHDLTGKISATPREIKFDSIHGITSTIAFGASGTYNPETGYCLLSGAAIADQPPVKWYTELPAGFQSFLETNKPTGQFQLKLDRLEREATDKPWNFKGTLAAANTTTNGPPSSISLAAGKISASVTGSYDAGSFKMTGALAGTELAVHGKTIDTLTAAIQADPVDKSLKFSDIDGKVAGGNLHGTITATFTENPGYSGDLTLSDASLVSLVLPPKASEEERKKFGAGRVTATLALQQTFGDANGKGADRTGRGHLDRRLVERRTYPAINVGMSGTRKEELLLDPKELELVYRLRKVLSDMNPIEAVELLKSRLEKKGTNREFLLTMNLA